MIKPLRPLIVGLFTLLCSPLLAQDTAPVVIETTPTIGARSVDPSLREIAVEFDQPMSTSTWSFCGGGYAFPPGDENNGIRYIDDRTIVRGVKLEPEHTYQFSINCNATGFRSASGIPVNPTPFYFTTSSGEKFLPSDVNNYAAWQKFRELFRDVYSYYDRTGTDWETILDDGAEWVLRAPTPQEWATRVAIMLRAAEDPHLRLKLPDGSSIGTYGRGAHYNANDQVIARAFPNLKKHNNLIWSGSSNGVGYLSIRGWGNENKEMEVLQTILADMRRTTRALILDVRSNGGGGEDLAMEVASWFLESSGVYARHRYRDTSSPTGWGDIRSRYINANPPEKRYTAPVLVLQGPVCLSSNEAFLLMMRLAPQATAIGEHSGGSSANPRSFDLSNGTKIVLPRWQSLQPDGTPFEGIGLVPEVEITGDFRNADPVLEEALRRAAEAVDADANHTQRSDAGTSPSARGAVD